MATNYVKRVSKLDWGGLRALWASVSANNTPGWAAGKAMEHLVLRAFELSGAVVQWPYSVKIRDEIVEQIDGAIHLDSLSCLVECKDSDAAVNITPIAKLRNQLLRRHAGVIGMVFSRGGFTEPAQTLAQFLAPQVVLLWSGREVDQFLQAEDCRNAFTQKYRYCVERGIPDFDIAGAIT